MVKKKHGKYEEPKVRVNISLTQTSINLLDRKASEMGLSRSEMIETMARQEPELSPEEKKLLGNPLEFAQIKINEAELFFDANHLSTSQNHRLTHFDFFLLFHIWRIKPQT